MNPRFSSKIDGWIGLLLIALPLATIGGAAVSLQKGSWQGLIGIAFVGLLYALLVFPMFYELDGDALVIRFGVFKRRVPYASIRRVTPTRNPLSSPALSLDRLHIDAGNPLGPNISPRDREGFLRALAERAPHLELAGDSLVSAK
jgi:hypothetical protein